MEDTAIMKKKWALAGVALAVLAAAVVLLGVTAKKPAAGAVSSKSYQYATVTKGSIEKSISASGSLEPVSTVSVLAQMSGRVESVHADFNDHVKKGQVLITLNTDMLKLQRLDAQAAVNKAQASYDLQALDYGNKTKLAQKGLVSDYDLASSKSSLAVCAATLESAKASLAIIDTELNQYALITSPIDGVVLDKNVEAGQSVVAASSSSATALFTLARDLSRMEIEAEVDELDIASVKTGQEVRFTIDSRPGTTYAGAVKAIHLVPTTSSNVVNYTVIISALNKDGSLLPGMTATLSFIEQQKSDILVVPNAALRFTPSALSAAEIAKKTYIAGLGSLTPEEKAQAEAKYDEEQARASEAKSEAAKKTGSGGLSGALMGGGPGFGGPPPGEGGRRSGSSASAASSAQGAAAQAEIVVRKPLWYLDSGGAFQCVLVTVGVTDGINTEVSGAEGLEGMKVILKEKAE
jgi:HlyD family secretion protein